LCPECNKAFTRKDNMEQHRRTHQTSRRLPKDLAHFAKGMAKTEVKRAKSISNSDPKPLAILASPPAESAEFAVPLSPAKSYSSYADSSIGLAPQPYPDVMGQSGYGYIDPAACYDTVPLTGLDTLAIAASADASRSP
jgi:Zinc finger, C2H2 type